MVHAWPQVRHVIVALAIGATSPTLGGCGGCGGDDGADPDAMPSDPFADRYPSARLPFPIRVTDPAVPESGTVVGRRIHFQDDSGIAPYYEWMNARTAVVALDDRVVVVFPPADRVGLDLAHAGLDQPWARVPLTDLPVQDIGDLDAIRDDTGTVWIAVRARHGVQPITLYRWRPGEAVTSEPVPRSGLTSATWFHDTCEDLALAVDPDGELHLFYQQVYPGQGDNALVHAHRAAGASDWQDDVMVYGADARFGPAVPGRFGVVGCRTVVEHDRDGSLFVATLHQRLSTQVLTTGQLVALPLTPLQVFGFFQDGEGQWRSAKELVALPDGRSVSAGPFFDNGDGWPAVTRGQFDLARHPDGFVLAAPSWPFAAGTRDAFEVRASSFSFDLDASGWSDLLHETQPPTDVDGERVGGRIVASECGGVYVLQEDWDTERYAISDRCCALTAAPGACLLEPAAPVISRDAAGDRRHPSYARGRRPYDVGLCVVTPAGDQVEICHGLARAAPTAAGRERLATIASREPSDPATLTGAAPLTLRMSRARGDDETPRASVMDVGTGRELIAIASSGGSLDRIVVTPSSAWQPGHQYRVAAWFDGGDDTADVLSPLLYADVARPVTSFRINPSPILPDTRTTLVRFPCDSNAQRESDGTCTQDHRPSPEPPGYVTVLFQMDFDNLPSPPTLEHPSGTIVPSTFGFTTSGYRVSWTTRLADATAYLVRFPAGTRTALGGPIHPDDLRHRFYTSGLPDLVSSVPANNATGVSLTAPLELVFDVAVTVPSAAVSLNAGASSVPLSILQLSPTTFRLTHGGLAPSTTYLLMLGDQIVDAENHPLVGAPLMITFQTGST